MFRKGLTGLVIVFMATSASAQGFGPAVTINGVEIPRAKVQAQTDHLVNQRGLGSGGITQPGAYQKIQEEVVEQVVVQELLWQEAQRRDVVVEDTVVEAEFQQLKKKFDSEMAFTFKIEEGGFTEETFRENIRQQMSVQNMISNDIAAKVVVDDAAIKEFYDANITEMAIPERVHARHILVKFDTSDAEARAAAEERLAKIRAKLDVGESFALVAIEHSEGPSSDKGGDLGYFGRGQMVKEFEDVAFTLEPGKVSGPVETQFGLHLIKVEDHVAEGVAPIADVQDKIRDYLAQQKLYSTVEQLIEDLRANGNVEIHLF